MSAPAFLKPSIFSVALTVMAMTLGGKHARNLRALRSLLDLEARSYDKPALDSWPMPGVQP